MPVLSIHDRDYPDDPYTVWRLAELADWQRDEIRGMARERLDAVLDCEGGLLHATFPLADASTEDEPDD